MSTLKTVTDEPQKTPRGSAPKSGTQYPYFDLNDSIEVAKTAHEQGGGTCGRDLIAAALKYSTTRSGGFLARLYAAKQFGLVDFDGDSISTTERATRVLHPVMPEDEQGARVEAFLAIPLFQKVYEKYKGGALPPEVGLKNLLKTEYKIVEDRIKPALRVMLDSAEQAGFFKATGDRSRMIAPTTAAPAGKLPSLVSQAGNNGDDSRDRIKQPGGGDGPPPGVHPALVAMLRELPRPGTEWPANKKERFMTAFRSIIDVVYPNPEESSS